MAKKQLTIEEKLEAALVPVEEQPYKVPENWCWSYLENVCQIIMGQSPKGADTTLDDSYTPLIGGAADLGDTAPIINKYTKSVTKLSQCGDLIICIRATLGRPVIADGEYCLGRGVAGFRLSRIDVSFLRFFFINFERYLYDNATGSTFAQVTSKVLGKMPIPLPPFLEQSRIVARIESLFTKLDEAKEKIQEVLDGADLRRAAILHQAFTGKLTEKWRKENNNIGQDRWEKKQLKDCCDIGSGGTPSRKVDVYYQGNISWVKTGEINWNKIYETEEHISEEAIKNSSAKLYQEGTVLVAMYGMGVTRGRAAILQIASATNQAVCALQPKEQLKNKFLFYYFMNNYWIIREKSVGGNQLNLSGKIIGKLEINLPTITEQQEIVRLLDNLLSREQSTVTACKEALNTIETLKKSILARAFRGELGTNAPGEASAKELLKEILVS